MNLHDYIFPGGKIVSYGIYLENDSTIIVSDFKLGIEDKLSSEGNIIPKLNFQKIRGLIISIFKKIGPVDKIIINGDIKVDCEEIGDTRIDELNELFKVFSKFARDIIVVKGTCDLTSLEFSDKINVYPYYYFEESKILICHGTKISEAPEYKDARRVIIGNSCPAVTLKTKEETKKFKCFLKGYFNEKILVAMPCMNQIRIGNDILTQDLNSPYLKEDLSEYRVWPISTETYYFGKVKNLPR